MDTQILTQNQLDFFRVLSEKGDEVELYTSLECKVNMQKGQTFQTTNKWTIFSSQIILFISLMCMALFYLIKLIICLRESLEMTNDTMFWTC